MDVYHFTSKESWQKIKKTAKLTPNSIAFNWARLDAPQDTTIVNEDIGYLVCLPDLDRSVEGYRNYGLLPYLIEKTTGEILLRLPVHSKKGAFVRELAFFSPKESKNRYGIDLWGLAWEEKLPEDQRQNWHNLEDFYLQSAVRLEDYKGNYNAPEIWLPQETPISKLTQIEAPKSV